MQWILALAFGAFCTGYMKRHRFAPLKSRKITYLGKKTTTGLNETKVTADAWNEVFNIPFTPDKAKCVSTPKA